MKGSASRPGYRARLSLSLARKMMEINEKVITGLIAAVSAIVGAIVAAIAKGYASKQKIQELRLIYEQKLEEGYLINAREYTQAVYVPINVALTSLNFAFQNLLARKTEKGTLSEDAINKFKNESTNFQGTIKNLSERGANAFLTTELDEKLQSFCSFLYSSPSASEPVIKVIFQYFLPFIGKSRYKGHVAREAKGKWAKFFKSQKFSWEFSLFDVGFSYEAEEILAAPIGSKEFEFRFSKDFHILSSLIKEVTLGSRAKRSA